MNITKSLLRFLVAKAAALAAVAVVTAAASAPLYAQTAEVRYAGVFYKNGDSGSTVENMYCDYQQQLALSGDQDNQSFLNTALGVPAQGTLITDGTVVWEYIGVGTDNTDSCTERPVANTIESASAASCYYVLYGSRYYFLRLAGSGTTESLINSDFATRNLYHSPSGVQDGGLSLLFVNDSSTDCGNARQTVQPYSVGDKYYVRASSSGPFYCFMVTRATTYSVNVEANSAENKSFTYADNSPVPGSAMSGHSTSSHIQDPWVSSALIEYDQPYPSDTPSANQYPNHCLSLCMNVYCQNKPLGGSTYSISFPIQQLKFDIVKYYNNKNIENPEEAPAVRTIDLYPNQESMRCGSYRCPGKSDDGITCNSAQYYCEGDAECEEKSGKLKCKCQNGTCRKFSDGTEASGLCDCTDRVCNFAVWNNDGIMSNADTAVPFCAAWDGSYEIAGEFGKSNGQFGFRATAATDVPGDSIITDKIQFSSTIAYPGMNQIPIQVDVTNIHTVRSTPSVVGNITAVAAQPYTYSYRLSKDADVRIAIFDASTNDSASYGASSTTDISAADVVRTLVDWQPRLGEGMKGREADVQITEFDSWDGRNDNGLLLPAGNYIVSLQAKSQDEWPGIDFSRAVTRQLSLDPLKLTDIQTVGLNKQSTAYASISYVPTESANVYWEVYTPGTSFAGADTIGQLLTDSSAATGTSPTPQGGSLVYRSEESRSGRMNFTSKWDGLCNVQGGCTRTYTAGEKKSDGTTAAQGDTETFAYGAPMPDGNYVYVLWAEIPYNGCYYNKASGEISAPKFVSGGACTAGNNTKQFTGVKTLKYETGILPVDRGLVEATIQPVSYSTVGSSPTAYGLDPFIFKYSIVRDATVVAKVTNTAGVDVKYLTPQEGVTQVAQQMNTLSWDGRDDAGRMVTPGTYMFVVETKDAMFPAVTNRASAVFPVDMYRVVDVSTTDVYGDSDAKATISYALSKAMNVQVNIYNKDVVIPGYNTSTGDYNSATVTSTTATTVPFYYVADLATSVTVTFQDGNTRTVSQPLSLGTFTSLGGAGTAADPYYRDTVTVSQNPGYVPGSAIAEQLRYRVAVSREYLQVSADATAAWPPRICDQQTDAAYFTSFGIDPSLKPQCIYVNDTSFNNYPTDPAQAASGVVDVRLQPIKTFDRSSTRVGEGITVTEEWDALYFRNPSKCAPGSTNLANCPYEMLPDGQYPFFISARSNEAFDRYYAQDESEYIPGAPLKTAAEVKQQNYLYATDKVTGKVNITRGPVYFLDGSTAVYPNAPQLFNVSSGPVFVPPYEINFSVSRAATVEVAIVALRPNVCNPDPTVHQDLKNNAAGDVCKYLSTMTIVNTGNFDPNVVRKIYWDGTDNNGFYVKPGGYEVRLIAKNYPDPGLYQETVKSITVNADLLKVFDLLEADGYSISTRGTDMRIGYQVSVPMKVAIQIFKPGTTIYDYQKGTLRNPTTGQEVQDIREVLVKAIVGIRPATTLIEEVWDGTDYAGQEVPDGTYPFRFVTALNSADIDSVTGEIVGEWAATDGQNAAPNLWKVNRVADTYEYQNLHKATIAIGDGRFVCADWEKTVFFYPNPLNNADRGTLEITKMPVPGEVSIKFFNLAGDLVRDSNYTCVDANNYQVTMGGSLSFNPDNNVSNTPWTDFNLFPSQRNAALRCRWDRTNQHGKKVARGVYFGLVDFKAKNGREHCQKVVKVLIP